MKILLLGKNGQVGWELQRALQPLGTILALDRLQNEDGLSGDVTNFVALANTISIFQPEIIVNATAYTAVDKAETETVQADLVNHLAVKNLAELCKEKNILLVHYSTDYVFNGEGNKAWVENDQTNPVNVYGQTKYKGELALEQSQTKFINFRTSWVYATKGHNFIKIMLNLAKTREELNIIHDQIGAPTGAALIADVTAQALHYYNGQSEIEKEQLCGHYHLVAGGETSWYEYANYIFSIARENNQELMIKQVNPIVTEAYPTPAKRPRNSRLNTSKLQNSFKLALPDWQIGVKQTVEEIII